MQLREFYNHFLEQLKPLYAYEEAAAISSMVFEHFAKADRTAIITHPQQAIDPPELILLEDALLQLKRNVPVQYVIGTAWFAGLPFKVTPAVLIPRPETEELVLAALEFCRKNNSKTVLDVGTGSGCIPISMKKDLDCLEVHAVDVSKDALQVAEENAVANSTRVSFIELDFLQEKNWEILPRYDIIVSNPPYIPEQEKNILDKNVTTHEPHLALFVPDNKALIFYEKLALFALHHLNADGGVFMETHENLAKEVAAHFSAKGYQARIAKDMFEKERMVIASRSR